ncbi:MAG: DUF433 domain-containing protein [Phycisphaerae bacterium]
MAAPSTEHLIISDPNRLGGEPCFAGTRVPVSFLFDCLSSGDSLDDFLRQYPTVGRDVARQVLAWAFEGVVAERTHHETAA